MNALKNFPKIRVDEAVERQVLADSESLMVVSFTFAKEGVGAIHHHPHIQSTYVESGHFTFTIDDTEFDVKAGDSFVIPANAPHGCVCHEAGRLIDTFTPRRDDFL